MKKSHSLTLTGPDVSDFIRRDTIKMDKGLGASALRLVTTIFLKNSSGAGMTPTDGDKRAVLDSIVADVKYGHDGARHPFKMLSFDKLRLLWRWLTALEFHGYNSDPNLNGNIAAGASVPVTLHLMVPTTRLWLVRALSDALVMGRTQARTLEAEFKWVSTGRAFESAGLAIDDTKPIKMQVYPDTVKQKTDRFAWLPEYSETNVRDFKATFPDGLPLLAIERTNPQAASPISRLNIGVDGQMVRQDVDPRVAYAQITDTANFPAAGDISDLATVLYSVKPGSHLRDLLSGRLHVEEPGQELASLELGFLSVPIVPQSEIDATLEELARLRGKGIKAVNFLAHEQEQFPSHLSAFQPFSLFDRQDAEFEKFPGVGIEVGGKPSIYLPASGLAAARAGVEARKAHGENLAIKDQVYQLARYIPGAAKNGRGFTGGSTRLQELASLVGAA